MISAEFRDIIDEVCEDARRRGLRQISAEHITLFLLSGSALVRRLLDVSGADIAGLKKNLLARLQNDAPPGGRFYDRCDAAGGDSLEINFAPDVRRILKRAHKFTQHDDQKIEGVHFLISVFSERDSFVAHNLYKHGLDRIAMMAFVGKHISASYPPAESLPDDLDNRPHRKTAVPPPAPKKAAPDWVAKAAAGQLERPLGMETPLARLIKILGRKYKNNPLIIGEPGVGKTSLVHALAHRIADGAAPPFLAGVRIVPVLIADLVAGTKYRGDFEQRIRQLVEKYKAHGDTIIFIDEIHTLIGTGAVSFSALDAANILKPLLNEDGIRYIGATTFAEYRQFIRRDAALARRFQTVELAEPDDKTLKTILAGVTERLSAFHRVAFAPDCAEAAAEYSRRYMVNRFLPDKAIDLLDDTAARHKMNRPADDDTPVTADDIRYAAVDLAGLPAGHRPPLKNFEQQLTARVFNQPAAAKHLSGAVLRGQLNYHNGAKTLGNYLFSGPTGVGKTEMAKQLAELLGLPLLRYDMTEYSERHALSRLIGAPPGYVGYENSGRLIEEVFRHPNAVILFDEVEKAHLDVLNILLQIMDYGRLTDNTGRTADFSNTVLILTSNLGAAEMETPPVGFERGGGGDSRWREAVDKFFPPEFRNRLDAVIYFNALSADVIKRIFSVRLAEIKRYLKKQKRMDVSLSPALRAAILKNGFSPTMGARPLERQLRDYVLRPLALAEAQELAAAGNRYHLHISDGEVTVSPVKTRARAAAKKETVLN